MASGPETDESGVVRMVVWPETRAYSPVDYRGAVAVALADQTWMNSNSSTRADDSRDV